MAAPPTIDWRTNCGNFAAAAALFAADDGLAQRRADGSAVARLWSPGANAELAVHLPSANAPLVSVPGVHGEGPPIAVDFVGLNDKNPLLPTGRAVEEDLRLGERIVRASLVNAGNPMVLIAAADGGLEGTECSASASSAVDWAQVDVLLDEAAERMGLSPRPSGMRLIWLSRPVHHTGPEGSAIAADTCDIVSRVSAGDRVHHAHVAGGAIALACAAIVPGTIAHELASGRRKLGGRNVLRIAHPQGVMSVHACVSRDHVGRFVARSAGFVRTARYLMVGEVVLP